MKSYGSCEESSQGTHFCVRETLHGDAATFPLNSMLGHLIFGSGQINRIAEAHCCLTQCRSLLIQLVCTSFMHLWTSCHMLTATNNCPKSLSVHRISCLLLPVTPLFSADGQLIMVGSGAHSEGQHAEPQHIPYSDVFELQLTIKVSLLWLKYHCC